jgi:hypothetical protein
MNLVTGRAFPRAIWLNCALGTVSCLGLVVATNALFLGDWFRIIMGITGGGLAGGWLLRRMFKDEGADIDGPETPGTAVDDPRIPQDQILEVKPAT